MDNDGLNKWSIYSKHSVIPWTFFAVLNGYSAFVVISGRDGLHHVIIVVVLGLLTITVFAMQLIRLIRMRRKCKNRESAAMSADSENHSVISTDSSKG